MDTDSLYTSPSIYPPSHYEYHAFDIQDTILTLFILFLVGKALYYESKSQGRKREQNDKLFILITYPFMLIIHSFFKIFKLSPPRTLNVMNHVLCEILMMSVITLALLIIVSHNMVSVQKLFESWNIMHSFIFLKTTWFKLFIFFVLSEIVLSTGKLIDTCRRK